MNILKVRVWFNTIVEEEKPEEKDDNEIELEMKKPTDQENNIAEYVSEKRKEEIDFQSNPNQLNVPPDEPEEPIEPDILSNSTNLIENNKPKNPEVPGGITKSVNKKEGDSEVDDPLDDLSQSEDVSKNEFNSEEKSKIENSIKLYSDTEKQKEVINPLN